jgi:hypothetical protein
VECGQLIAGRYRLRERLGQGGMSVVWRAEDGVLGREVAVKVLSAAPAGDPDRRRRIRDEARSAARVRHANVVAVYDYGEFTDAGRTMSYVVMELVDGRTLADMLTGGRLPWKVTALVGAQVAAALAAAHADGIVHRDVKPANVMVTSSGVKLVDFGISAAVGTLDGPDGQVLGTPAYLAPERIEGSPVRPATDVYALGLLMYLALAGRMPWEASTVTQMVRAHVYAKPAPVPPIAGLPPGMARLVSRCLAKRPAERPSAIYVAETLGEVAGLPSSALLRSVTAPTVAIASARRRPGRASLVAVGVVAAMAIAGGVRLAGDGPARPAGADPVAVRTGPVPTSSAPPGRGLIGTPAPEPTTAGTGPTARTDVTAPKAKVKAKPAKPGAQGPAKAPGPKHPKRPGPK